MRRYDFLSALLFTIVFLNVSYSQEILHYLDDDQYLYEIRGDFSRCEMYIVPYYNGVYDYSQKTKERVYFFEDNLVRKIVDTKYAEEQSNNIFFYDSLDRIIEIRKFLDNGKEILRSSYEYDSESLITSKYVNWVESTHNG
jgi:hypothetical protein